MVVGTIDTDGGVSVAAYGDPVPDALPLDAYSVFEIGSITKVFTATLLADMADRKEVALDDPVSKYLPSSVHIPERNGRKITLIISARSLRACRGCRTTCVHGIRRIHTPTTRLSSCTIFWATTR